MAAPGRRPALLLVLALLAALLAALAGRGSAPSPAAAQAARGPVPAGGVVRPAGSPSLFVCGADGLLHWASDTRALQQRRAAGEPAPWAGMRDVTLAEPAGHSVGDVDLDLGVAVVLGKGRRRRACPFGRKTARAPDRYLRARAGHPHGDRPELGLGQRGRLTDSGVLQMVVLRAARAGIGKTWVTRVHLFRHTFAHSWLAAGGQAGGLMPHRNSSHLGLLLGRARPSAARESAVGSAIGAGWSPW